MSYVRLFLLGVLVLLAFAGLPRGARACPS
jgi:hypothetical protein